MVARRCGHAGASRLRDLSVAGTALACRDRRRYRFVMDARSNWVFEQVLDRAGGAGCWTGWRSPARAGRRAAAGIAVLALALFAPVLCAPVEAQTADEPYKGKQIRIVVGTAAGQDYDSWARLIGRHLPRFLPGNPAVIVENMPGAGHILATNYLFNLAPRDGTVIGMVSRNMTEAAIMKLPNVRFEPARFNWIGSPELNHRVLFVNATSGFASVPDLYARELIVGTPGGAQGVSAAPILLKNLLHMRIKIIQGYHSPGDVILAMARREVEGIVQSVGAPEGARRQWVESGQMRILFSMERERVAGLAAPTIFEFAKSEEQRQVLAFLSSSMGLGGPLRAPPGVP